MSNESEPIAQKTVQTVQEEGVEGEAGVGKKKTAYFEVASDQKGEWNWVLWSSNGQAMAINAKPYPRRNDCTTAIRSIIKSIPTAKRIVIAHEA